MRWIIKLFFGYLLFQSTASFSQVTAPEDTVHLYSDIEKYAKRNKFNNFLYRLFFRPTVKAPVAKAVKLKKSKKVVPNPFSAYQGKIIRYINIETLDPFGTSIKDTTRKPQNFIGRSGNKLHIKSQRITMRNLILIRQNQPFDSLLYKESERLIRAQRFVQDVTFTIIGTSKKNDSVDIFIRELDKWTIIPRVAASPTKAKVNLIERNFLGLGHEFGNELTWYHLTGDYAYQTRYYIPNIRNTFINATAFYSIDEFKSYIKSLAIDRPFYSPLTKYGGGVYFEQQYSADSILYNDSAFFQRTNKFNTQDYWAGKSWQIAKGNTVDDRTTSLTLTQRILRIHFLENPFPESDTLIFDPTEVFYLTGIGIAKRKYFQDKYIFNYGITEDIPTGFVYSLTGGYQIKSNRGRVYAGLRIAFGGYNDWGYLSSNIEYGTFFRSFNSEQGVFSISVNYFSDLFEIGKWKFRQFARPQLTIGINRIANENITLIDESGIKGFSNSPITGTKKLALTLQTQSYAPWNVIGFRFGPYLISSFQVLGTEASGFHNSRLYSRFELGLLLKNDYLVFNFLRLSIAFYPIIPGQGKNITKINSSSVRDFVFRDFVIGKPTTILFQ